MRILLIEDDLLIGDGLFTGLRELGFTIDWIKNGLEGKESLYQVQYDAVILDLGLPGQDGLSVLKEWRRSGKTEPVLILTAQGDVDHRIAGLDSGADDYMGKPFSLREIAARIRALIRRVHTNGQPLLVHGDITFSPSSRTVTLNGQTIELLPKEINLLELFMMNKNQVFSKNLIEEKLYSWDDDINSNTIEVHIHNLRKKLGSAIIRTVYKTGYIMDDL